MDVRDCALPIRQKLEIARAIAREPRILLLDEPTSALSARDVEWLGRRIAELRERGTTVVLITHRVPEVRRFCDRLTILRNGRHVGSFAVPEISDEEVVRLVIGRSLAAVFPKRQSAPPQRNETPALSVRDMRIKGQLDEVSLDLWPGEILGVAGLQGMGQNELFYALFGMTPTDGGSIEVRGEPVELGSPRDAIDAGIGISLVPEDRKTEALALKLSGRENVSLPVIDRFARFGWLDLGARAPRRRPHSRARAGASARALSRLLHLQRRQSAKDRDRQMAAGGEPDIAAVRSDPRRGYRNQARDLSLDAGIRRCRRRHPVLFDRRARDRQSLRPGRGDVFGTEERGTVRRRNRRGDDHAHCAGRPRRNASRGM